MSLRELDHQSAEKAACKEIAESIESILEDSVLPLTSFSVWKQKLEVCRKYELSRVPKNSEILEFVSPNNRKELQSLLMRKSVRTASGIAVVTVITEPFDCPHGACTFCPGGVRFGTPQSYTKSSPAASFGAARNYDPQTQVRELLSYLESNGHDTSKVEMILLGGTILAMPQDYKRSFVKACYDALNDGDENANDSGSLSESIRRNETSARHRCVGLTIETKPDWCRVEHIDELLSYSSTRVEIGVQSLREDVLKATNRGHTVADTVSAMQVSKDSCFKIVAHMMPGLPKSNADADLEDLLALFNDERFRPDMLKIYPTLVVEGTALYNQFKMGLYHPYEIPEIVDILCKFKSKVPPWVRIMRIQREIPGDEIASGARAGNLRQLVFEEMERRNLVCMCIRCREVGHHLAPGAAEPSLKRIEYRASGGDEIFLSFEDLNETLYGFVRLRIPSGSEERPEIKNQRAALVRELHVYGRVVPVGKENPGGTQPQHRGLGSALLLEAERIATREFSRKKIIVISASGTREYYRKRGYRDDGAFVSKSLVD